MDYWIGNHVSVGRAEECDFVSVSFLLVFTRNLLSFYRTQEGGIAATMSGNQCLRHPGNIVPVDVNCSIVIDEVSVFCGDIPEQVPGSNLYFACWLCMLSSMAIAFKWKAAQALKFAQAKAERQQKKEREEQRFGSDYSDDDDDDGIDDDDDDED